MRTLKAVCVVAVSVLLLGMVGCQGQASTEANVSNRVDQSETPSPGDDAVPGYETAQRRAMDGLDSLERLESWGWQAVPNERAGLEEAHGEKLALPSEVLGRGITGVFLAPPEADVREGVVIYDDVSLAVILFDSAERARESVKAAPYQQPGFERFSKVVTVRGTTVVVNDAFNIAPAFDDDGILIEGTGGRSTHSEAVWSVGRVVYLLSKPADSRGDFLPEVDSMIAGDVR